MPRSPVARRPAARPPVPRPFIQPASRRWRAVVAASLVACVLAGARPAEAVFLSSPAWTRNSGHTTYQGWDFLQDPAGNSPDQPGLFNPNATTTPPRPYLYDSNAASGSFNPGSGNIYSPTGFVQIDIDVPEYNLGAGYVTTVLLQTRTSGSQAVYTGAGGFRLTYNDGATNQTILPTSASILSSASDGRGGQAVDYAAVFNVPFSPQSLKLEVDAAGTSMSFGAAHVDTIVTRAVASSTWMSGMDTTVGFPEQPVPEPSIAGMALLGLPLLLRRRRTGAGAAAGGVR